LEQYVFEELPGTNEYFILWRNDNTISIGKYQNTISEINVEYVKAKNINVVRRLSGGGAVYHDLGGFNFTLIMDAENAEDLNLHMFTIPVVKALKELGVEAEQNGRNDITVNGRKFSGNAQYFKNGRIMHHGTVLFDSDLDKIAAALKVSSDKIESKGFKSVRSRVANLKDYLPPEITLTRFENLLKEYMFKEIAYQYVLKAEDLNRIREIQKERYDTWEWNYGFSPEYDIHKERFVEGCEKIEINMEVKNGVITKFMTFGDYFGTGETPEIWNLIIGKHSEEKELVLRMLQQDTPLPPLRRSDRLHSKKAGRNGGIRCPQSV
jgi:lipoate-protein ligase A